MHAVLTNQIANFLHFNVKLLKKKICLNTLLETQKFLVILIEERDPNEENSKDENLNEKNSDEENSNDES